MNTMHHQYLTTRDIKFPDQKRYTKPGDLLLFNDTNSTLTIYRNTDLVGTVHFSKGGLHEFIRLGWIASPTEMNAEKPVDDVFDAAEAGCKATNAMRERMSQIADNYPDIVVKASLNLVEEHTLELPKPLPKRKIPRSKSKSTTN